MAKTVAVFVLSDEDPRPPKESGCAGCLVIIILAVAGWLIWDNYLRFQPQFQKAPGDKAKGIVP